MNNVHPIFRGALAAFAPKPSGGARLDELLVPGEVDISTSHHAEPIFVTPDADVVKEAAAEVLTKHARELDDTIVRLVREQGRRR